MIGGGSESLIFIGRELEGEKALQGCDWTAALYVGGADD